MYTPGLYQFQDQQEMLQFMKHYSFATIITVKDNVPIATHLPFSIDQVADQIILSSHFGAANEQAKYIEENTSLVIFSEPHAYISPSHYDKHESVPTWDYIAVHAYGKCRVITDEAIKIKMLEQMIHTYEKEYMQQWDTLSDKFKTGMMKGIVAFELEVTDLQGSKKLSQNKTVAERERIIQHLEHSTASVEQELAKHLKAVSK